MISAFLSVFRLGVFMALGFSLALPMMAATLGADLAAIRERVETLAALREEIMDHRRAETARDLHEIGVDATWRRGHAASGLPQKHDRLIAPRPGARIVSGKILSADLIPVLHHEGYLHLRVDTPRGIQDIITAEPMVMEILAGLAPGQDVWLRGEERLRLRHGHAMARRASRAIELTHFVIPPDEQPLLAQAQIPTGQE